MSSNIYNVFFQLPAQITRLRRLKILYLGGNKLDSLPSEIGQLEYLQSLSLSGSPLGLLTPTWLRIEQLCKADPSIFLRQLLVLPGLSSIWKTRALCTVRSEQGT